MQSPSPATAYDSRASSPAADRQSRFSYRHLAQLAASSTSCPLRVIAHIDLDAFYAQCEMVRLDLPVDKPLAVLQWQGLIAVNYPARAFGIGRHCTITEAKKLCPELIAQHVATWREGEEKWAYRDGDSANIVTDKVSLDPYRLESRKILTVIKECLPQDIQKVEKASVDEVFVDLSAQIHSMLLQKFPELAAQAPLADPNARLPMPPVSALDWQADALIDLDEAQESQDPDWDDVAILMGSEIVRDIRAAVKAKLNYTCSAGIANNKLVSKLGSGHKKPNSQTVIRSRAVSSFLSGMKFTKMRNLGGKRGDQVATTFGTEEVAQLLAVPLDQMKAKLGDDTGTWVYNTVRGIDTSEVNPRTQIKSMLSAKSFRPTISSPEQAVRWLRIFAADIYARLVEEGVLENRRRPKTINLYFRHHEGQMRSRSCAIPSGKIIEELGIFELAKTLFSQILAEGRVWPCANLSLSVGGFEDGITGNMGIHSFLVKREEKQQQQQQQQSQTQHQQTQEQQSNKTTPSTSTPAIAPSTDQQGYLATTSTSQIPQKRKAEEGGIQRFFSKSPFPSNDGSTKGPAPPMGGGHAIDVATAVENAQDAKETSAAMQHVCARCQDGFSTAQELQSHQDWHMAQDIHREERARVAALADRTTGQQRASPIPRDSGRGRGRPRGRGAKLGQGQSRLDFG